MTFKNPQQAFENALAKRVFSRNKHSRRYVGNYMYMCSSADGKIDYFKHSITRKYLEVK